jgi:DNA modification methylase
MKIRNGEFWLGDCLELMKNVPDESIDMILCDLPYGTTACAWDSIIPFDFLWENYWRVLKKKSSVILTTSQPFTTSLINSQINNFKYCWYWKKNFSTNFLHAKRQPLRNFEEIVVFIKGSSFYYPIKTTGHKPTQSAKGSSNGDLWHGNKKRNYEGGETERYPTQFLEFNAVDPKGRIHPTQKPVELFEYLIKTYTKEGDIVLDNCAGSGTTAIAAENLNRRWLCIEKEEEYYKKAINRINDL